MEQTPFHLNGKRILVTGASSGIGRQTVLMIRSMGGEVVLNGRNVERLKEVAVEAKCFSSDIIPADLTSVDDRAKLAQTISQIDGIVHCAGHVHPFPVKFIDQTKIDETLSVNFDAPVLMTAALLKAKKINNGASLVYLSSISSSRPQKGAALYGGSKAALESFVKVLAQELAPQKIRVNSLSPAMVKTPMYAKAEEMVSKEEMDKHVAKYLLGVGYPEDVANSAVFLLSPASRWITGINLTLDGGILL